MNRLDQGEAREVAGVERKDALDTVDKHRCGDAGIVDLDAGDGVGNEEPAPDDVNFRCVGEHRDLVFDHARPPIRLRGRQAEAVAIKRPRQNVPELAEILLGVAGKIARVEQKINSTNDKLRLRRRPDIPAKKHIAVEQGLDFTSYEWSP